MALMTFQLLWQFVKNLRLILVLLAAGLGLAACGTDQNQMEYQASQQAKYLAIQNAKSGPTTGVASLKSDNSVLGAAQVNVQSLSDAQSSGDGLTQGVRATMSFHVTISGFSNGQNAQFTFSGAAFDLSSNVLTGTVMVNDLSSSSAAKIEAHLSGTLSDGGAFDGFIYVDGQEQNTIHIQTRTNSNPMTQSIPQVQTWGILYIQNQLTTGLYTGDGVLPAIGKASATATTFTLNFMDTNTSDQDRFMDLLFTQRPVALNLQYIVTNAEAGSSESSYLFNTTLKEPEAGAPLGTSVGSGVTPIRFTNPAVPVDATRFNGIAVAQGKALHISALGNSTVGGNQARLVCDSTTLAPQILGWNCTYTSPTGGISQFQAQPGQQK